ncbi:MAG: hypothetical protein JKX85_08655 [Phycisphaeraceae bacterium]|nr:hypothetical protein [Phycisphaeraceae bacterium]
MRIINLLLISVLLITSGCDQESSRQIEGRNHFDQVLDTLREVELGYVTASAQEIQASQLGKAVETNRQSMDVYRQKKLGKAFEALKPILTKGTAKQQVAAQRLVADIYTSSARFQLRLLMDQWTSLSSRSVVMTSYAVAVGRSYSLANNMQSDDTKLIAQLKKKLRNTTVELEKLEKIMSQLDVKAKNHQVIMANLKKQINSLNKQSQDLKRDSFVAKGDSKYKLLNDASAVSRKASILDAKRQLEQARLENVNAQRAMLTEQVDFTLEFMDSLERQIQGVTARHKSNEKQKTHAKQNLIDTENRFMDEFNVVVEQFTTKVQPHFAQINSDMQEALQILAKAHQQADSQTQQLIEIEILAKQVSLTNMQTTMMMVTHDLGKKYALILARSSKGKHKLMADRTATFQSAYDLIVRTQLQIQQQAQDTLGKSRKQATITKDVVSEDSALSQLAVAAKSPDIERLASTIDELNILLDNYAKRINDYKLN